MAFTTFLLFYDQGPPFQIFVHFRANLWLTLSKQMKMRYSLQKETSWLCTLLSCKKEKGHLNNAPICKLFFLYQTQNVTSIYGMLILKETTSL